MPLLAKPPPSSGCVLSPRATPAQSRTVASFMLTWWNAPTSTGFNLADRWTEQRKGPPAPAHRKAAEGIARDMAATVAIVAAHRADPITCRGLAFAQRDSHG